MAAASTSGEARNLESRGFRSSKYSDVNFVDGSLLSIKDVSDSLKKQGKGLNDSGKKMLENLQNMEPHNFKPMEQEFKVSHLQHVTKKSFMKGICEEECFRITIPRFRSGAQEIYSDLSFWTAIVAKKDVTEARDASFVRAKEKIRWLKKEHEKKIRAQFANSPAFKPASRFGNFKFSFQLSDLLDLYQAQHCAGEEPQLRILGTDLYKQEIAHYILVHSPDNTDQFRDLPIIPTDSDEHSFAYLKDKTMYWTPESTSNSLKLKISEDGPSPKTCYKNCAYYIDKGSCVHTWKKNYKVPSLWNHLVIAFHLPNHRVLKIPREQLLKNLTACNIGGKPLLDKDEQLELNKAQEIVKEMKSGYERLKREGSPQVQNGAKKRREAEVMSEASCSSVSDDEDDD